MISLSLHHSIGCVENISTHRWPTRTACPMSNLISPAACGTLAPISYLAECQANTRKAMQRTDPHAVPAVPLPGAATQKFVPPS